MGHDHSHNHFETARSGNKKALILALGITAGIMLLEFFGGLLTNSLALIADSGHMLSDTVSLFRGHISKQHLNLHRPDTRLSTFRQRRK